MNSERKTQVRSGSISQYDQVTRLCISSGIEIAEADVYELLDLCQPYTRGTGPLLIVLPEDISISFAAIRTAARVKGVPRIALVANKGRLLEAINIVFGVLKRFGMKSRLRYFPCEEEAVVWLLAQA